MAKESKKKKTPASGGFELSPWILFFIATTLLVAGWLMKSFPLLITVALSPLFAITDKTYSEEKFWTYAELILISLTISLLAGHIFQLSYLISAIIQAIGYTLAFVGYGFVHQTLGPRVGKFTIIIFWLGIEYVFLKLQWPADHLFLADAVQLKTDWLNWTFHTGYLGASLWILTTNLMFYLAFFKGGKFDWTWLVVFLIILIAPIGFSYTTELNGISREDMMALYLNAENESNGIYLKRGEFIPRTTAWISVLIFIFALVKSKTQKK